jgi:iron complex outermembrane receptor protein
MEGKPLTGIKVEISEIPSTTQTLSDGSFVFENIPPGVYRVIFTHPDYLADSATVDLREKTSKFIQVTLAARNPILLTIKEEITVTAEADSIIDISLPSHRTILPSSVLTELGTANIAEAVEKIPGVEMVGKGGYSMVPAIRGLAEHRILMLVDGVRVTSERRIGASASFINLNDIDHIEVNRGPYSVFHGSGAIGGVISIVTKTPSPQAPFRGAVRLGYSTVRKEGRGSLDLSGSWKGFGLMMAANGKKANDYSSPAGKIGQSHYTDYALMFKVNRQGRDSQFYLTLYNYWGVDIGKPSPSSKLKPRWYPKERNTIFTMGYKVKNKLYLDTLNASFYFYPSMLKTQKENLRETLVLKKRNLAELEGTNFGLKLRCGKQLDKKHTLNFGFDFFGRSAVQDKNTEWKYDSLGNLISITEETSLDDARRNNLGFFLDDKFQVSSSLTLNMGARVDYIHTSNSAGSSPRISRSDTSLSAYIGSLLQITPRLSILFNLGRSFRFPTISELFYTGLTGRGTVFGNPDLEPEKSLNLDMGLRYLHERFYASIYGFTNSVSDMIQKYLGSGEEEYYYRNLSSGRITGIEGEFYLWLIEDVEFFLNFHHIKGREQESDASLNYIPTFRLALWAKYSPGKFWAEPKITLSAAKEDPGPLEIETKGYTLLEAIFGYKFSTNLTLLAIIQNLLNQEYRANADEQGVVAPGRGVVLKASYSF